MTRFGQTRLLIQTALGAFMCVACGPEEWDDAQSDATAEDSREIVSGHLPFVDTNDNDVFDGLDYRVAHAVEDGGYAGSNKIVFPADYRFFDDSNEVTFLVSAREIVVFGTIDLRNERSTIFLYATDDIRIRRAPLEQTKALLRAPNVWLQAGGLVDVGPYATLSGIGDPDQTYDVGNISIQGLAANALAKVHGPGTILNATRYIGIEMDRIRLSGAKLGRSIAPFTKSIKIFADSIVINETSITAARNCIEDWSQGGSITLYNSTVAAPPANALSSDQYPGSLCVPADKTIAIRNFDWDGADSYDDADGPVSITRDADHPFPFLNALDTTKRLGASNVVLVGDPLVNPYTP